MRDAAAVQRLVVGLFVAFLLLHLLDDLLNTATNIAAAVVVDDYCHNPTQFFEFLILPSAFNSICLTRSLVTLK